jgi:putative endonuclease
VADQAAWLYIVTNKPRGVLYTGATSDLSGRIKDHRRGHGARFTAKFNCNILVYCESFPDMASARKRELQVKAWKRPWKIGLIESVNPLWLDLPVVEIELPKRSV